MDKINMKINENEFEPVREVNGGFYEKYNLQIRAVVSRILNNAGLKDDVDDCVNTVYLEIMEKLMQYSETRGTMGAFVTVIARSVALNYCKSGSRRSAELIGDEKLDFLSSPIGYQDEAEFDMLVESIIARLNRQERVLFAMRFLYEYAPEEIAKALKIRRSAVDMRVNRLKTKIKSFLTKGGVII